MKMVKSGWRRHLVSSMLAGVTVALLSYLYEVMFTHITATNLVLFASVGASAVVLTNSRSHKLTKLRTVVVGYMVAIAVSSMVYVLNTLTPLNISVNIFLLVSIVGFFLFLYNAVHPPAITASLSFILLDRPLADLVYLFSAIIILFVAIRLLTYMLYQHLTVREFVHELK